MDLKVATSMKDVENSDHLFVLADSDSKGARGATSMLGWKGYDFGFKRFC